MKTPVDGLRTSNLYSIPQAARLANTSAQNVRNWLYGSTRPDRRMKPVGGFHDDGTVAQVSFLELAEILVVARFRQRGGQRVPLNRLRKAHDFARSRLGVQHPFASKEFKVQGGHVMHDFEGSNPGPGKLAIDMDGRFVLPMDFRDTMDLFEFDPADGLAARCFPQGRDVPVLLDPEHAAGRLTVLGTNVRVETILKRWKADWSIEDIGSDFEVSTETVEAVVRSYTVGAEAA